MSCKAKGGYLVRIDNAGEDEFLQRQAKYLKSKLISKIKSIFQLTQTRVYGSLTQTRGYGGLTQTMGYGSLTQAREYGRFIQTRGYGSLHKLEDTVV